jgi:hypothetical protein
MPIGFEPPRLRTAEQDELEELAGKLRRHREGRWDLSPLDDQELDRLKVLVRTGQKSGDGGQLRGRVAKLKTREQHSCSVEESVTSEPDRCD